MMQAILENSVFILITIGAAVLLGKYIYKVYAGKRTFLTPLLQPVERACYRLMKIDEQAEMTAKQYIIAILSFSLFGFLLVLLVQLGQQYLFLNPEQLKGVPFWTAVNTAVSFVTNTNWQSYAGEQTMSYLTQSIALTVQNFVSAATGIAVVFAVFRGFTKSQTQELGNFWKDMTRIILYVLLPISVVIAIVLMSQGVVQSLGSYVQVTLLESGSESTIPLGMAASQVAIKQLGTNGGGFFGANAAFPLENPTVLSNFIEMLAIIIIPASLCFTFGEAVKNKKQGTVLFVVMLVFLIVGIGVITVQELNFTGSSQVLHTIGNMEGKEWRFGITESSTWSAVATAVSSGSVNSMLDSYTPLASMVLMLFMQLGEIIFGGAGSGLYGMLAFCLLTVFISGLMVGRTPEFLGKKIEPFDMKMISIIILLPTILTLSTTALIALLPQATDWVGNSGAHGFSEVLYNMTSSVNNNGSSFAGFVTNSTFMNVLTSILMLCGRFVPMIAIILLASNFAQKKKVAIGKGTLQTTNGTFVATLTIIIVVIGALSFLPALALGPIIEFLQSI